MNLKDSALMNLISYVGHAEKIPFTFPSQMSCSSQKVLFNFQMCYNYVSEQHFVLDSTIFFECLL